MTGQLYIDGKDAYLEWGVGMDEDGMKQLVQWAAFKKVDSTNWPEDDGEEFDLSAPVLDTRNVNIEMYITAAGVFEDFLQTLADGGAYHTFDYKPLGRAYTLRYLQCSAFKYIGGTIATFTLQFADDYPEVPTAEPEDAPYNGTWEQGVSLDGYDFSRFGIWVTDDAGAAVHKAAKAKKNLTMDLERNAGVDYDGGIVVFETKDVQLPLVVNAPTAATFWLSMDSLMAQLCKAGEHVLAFEGKRYKCFYKKMATSKVKRLPCGGIWCEFKLTLTFTKGVAEEEIVPPLMRCGITGLRVTEAGELRII